MTIQQDYWSGRTTHSFHFTQEETKAQRTKISCSTHIANWRIQIWVFWLNSVAPPAVLLNAPQTSSYLLILTNNISLGNDCYRYRDTSLESCYPLRLNYVHIVYDWGGDERKAFCHGQHNNYPSRSSSFWGFSGDLIFTLYPLKSVLAAHIIIPIPL